MKDEEVGFEGIEESIGTLLQTPSWVGVALRPSNSRTLSVHSSPAGESETAPRPEPRPVHQVPERKTLKERTPATPRLPDNKRQPPPRSELTGLKVKMD